MVKRSWKLAAVFALLCAAWMGPAEAAIHYLTCETYCCWGYGTSTSECTPESGGVTTCDQWWRGHACGFN
jgi:hypothetical protein